MPPSIETLFTTIKNKTILPLVGLGSHKKKVLSDSIPREITEAILEIAEQAVETCAGFLSQELLDYLSGRGVSAAEIKQYRICSTRVLVDCLPLHVIDNLTLRLPEKLLAFTDEREIHGLSFPYWYDGKFCGFATRVLNHEAIKYTFSIPHRLCFGVDFSKSEIWVVEGVFDAISLKRAGYNAFGMGDSQPNVFKMWTAAKFETINLLFDDDLAGWLGVQRAWMILRHMLEVPEERINIWGLCGGVDPEAAFGIEITSFAKVTIAEAGMKAEAWRKWELRNGQ